MSITKQLLQEDWAQVLLTNINSLNKFFLYDGKKQKNSGKSLKLQITLCPVSREILKTQTNKNQTKDNNQTKNQTKKKKRKNESNRN